MLDPVSIGLAFTAAQTVVNNIKSAINTGKDVYGVVKDISKFFNLDADIQKANIDRKLDLLKKSDAELQAQALETAWMASRMQEYRRDLKNLLYWSGNSHIWDNMEQEYVRLIKQKKELERQQREADRKHKQKVADAILTGTVAFMTLLIVGFLAFIAIKIYLR